MVAECGADAVDGVIRVWELGYGMDLAEQLFNPAQCLDATDGLREGGGMDSNRRALQQEREMEVSLNREVICELALLPRGIAKTLVEGFLRNSSVLNDRLLVWACCQPGAATAKMPVIAEVDLLVPAHEGLICC
ncbi:hypothetical protein [Granulicella tundricola]|uniref:Uncharacterized protein n=1 Tax=Granulicella tundricola (strain ATCC BAA-1859 / DSM 23138 / MP5ACTX9) TaxID=1198114 RepID=E8X6J3_GRATM|nr:hypothetical protein [Granulicella tundricola]ADW71143.1 hypothetical protein AciX9_3860 [Granulicella tundricola MP5ACTX9]